MTGKGLSHYQQCHFVSHTKCQTLRKRVQQGVYLVEFHRIWSCFSPIPLATHILRLEWECSLCAYPTIVCWKHMVVFLILHGLAAQSLS